MTDGVLKAFRVQETLASANTVGMGEAFHLDDIFGYRPETITTVPTRVSEYSLRALGMAIIGCAVP